MSRDTLKGISVTLAALLVALGICELAVRLIGSAPEVFHVQEGRFRLSHNPLIGYELVPNYQSDHDGLMVDFAEKANSLGFRDREHEVKKPNGTYRILILGDSITQGWMIASRDDIFSSVLENRLIAAGRQVEVLNFGVNGYHTRQEVETLREKGLQFEPALVIVAYCVNDMFLDSGGIHRDLERRRDQQAKIKIPRVLFKSALFRQVWAVVMTYSQKPLPDMGTPQDRSDQIVSEAFASLKELADQHNFAVLVAAFPNLTPLAKGPDPDLFTELEAIVRRHDFHMLDLSTVLSEAAKKEAIVIDDLHPNRYGNRCVGEALADFVQSKILISSDQN
jgi:lysophospholipase L1-like esterase